MINLWDYDMECAKLISIPEWIDQDITPCTVAAIVQGGCESGAYMPACTYYQAAQTMAKHGDDVLDYLQNCLGELPSPPKDVSWSGLACFYLSFAINLWAAEVEEELKAAIESISED